MIFGELQYSLLLLTLLFQPSGPLVEEVNKNILEYYTKQEECENVHHKKRMELKAMELFAAHTQAWKAQAETAQVIYTVIKTKITQLSIITFRLSDAGHAQLEKGCYDQ